MSEILKTLWEKIYAWAIPTALALGVYCFFVYPKTTIGHKWLDGTTDTQKTVIFVMVTATVAFCLNAFSSPLYRLLEGYLWPRWLQTLGTKRQLARKGKLQKLLPSAGWRRGLELEKLALYPKRDDQVVPTRFGNAIRSFETYGKTRFNLDSQSLWYELSAVAPKFTQTAIKEARSVVDFFVALTYLSALLGIATLIISAYERFDLSILIVCILAFATALLCHWLAVRATGEWGYSVRALVNIGRSRLAHDMGLELPDKLQDEKLMWGLVTRYGFYCNEEDGVRLDRFRTKPTRENLKQENDDEPIDKAEMTHEASSDPDNGASDPAASERDGETDSR